MPQSCVSVKLFIDDLSLFLSFSRFDAISSATRGGRVFLEARVHTQLESAREERPPSLRFES